MNTILIIHILASLFTVLFAVHTFFHIFQRYSLQHRIDAMSKKLAPLIIRKLPKQQIVDSLKKEGYVENELNELYDKLSANFSVPLNQTQQLTKKIIPIKK